jgi:hypothetical protein
VDLTNPSGSQYFGLSLAEAFGKYLPQKFPLDILVLARRAKIDELTKPISDVTVCSASLTPNPCETSSTHLWGGAIAISIDAGSLVAEVIKSIAK